MKTIGLIAAMPQEIQPLLKKVGKRQSGKLGAILSYRFRINDLDCLLIESGVGQRNAAQAVRSLLAVEKPEILISFGIAGAAGDDLRIGDVITGSMVYLLEAGIPVREFPLASLDAAYQHEISLVLGARDARLVTGTILTTSGLQPAQGKIRELLHPVVEMETFAIAEAAAGHGIPLLSLRSISDNPEAPIPFPIEKMYDAEYRLRIGWMLLSILRRPRLLSQLTALSRNSGIAAENAARAVLAFLTQAFKNR